MSKYTASDGENNAWLTHFYCSSGHIPLDQMLKTNPIEDQSLHSHDNSTNAIKAKEKTVSPECLNVVLQETGCTGQNQSGESPGSPSSLLESPMSTLVIP